jgi:Na+-driven multidrug efflux pump
MLGIYGGDSYIAIMTVLNSVREIFMLPLNGVTHGAQPVMGYNYGAKEYGRVRQAVRFTTLITITYTVLAWVVVMLIPGVFIRMFSSNAALLTEGVRSLKIFFFGFFFMAFQVSGQATFVGLGKSRQAVFFSLLRKAFIVVPLTILLPRLGGLGVDGVFLAEPISNCVGGLAAFITMMCTVYRRLKKEEQSSNS